MTRHVLEARALVGGIREPEVANLEFLPKLLQHRIADRPEEMFLNFDARLALGSVANLHALGYIVSDRNKALLRGHRVQNQNGLKEDYQKDKQRKAAKTCEPHAPGDGHHCLGLVIQEIRANQCGSREDPRDVRGPGRLKRKFPLFEKKRPVLEEKLKNRIHLKTFRGRGAKGKGSKGMLRIHEVFFLCPLGPLIPLPLCPSASFPQ